MKKQELIDKWEAEIARIEDGIQVIKLSQDSSPEIIELSECVPAKLRELLNDVKNLKTINYEII